MFLTFSAFFDWNLKKDVMHILGQDKNSAANLQDAFPIYGFVVSGTQEIP